jgi:hypothetical protein
MKQFRFFAPITIVVSMTAFLFSCNSGDKKKADEPVMDTTAVKAPEPPSEPAKPANIMIVIHKVANFTKWLPIYESYDSLRLANGLHSAMLARGTKDTNMVMVVARMDDAAKAKEFAASPGLKDAMKKSGVTGAPTISYLDMQMLDTTVTGTSRMLITHKVKDWDAWKKVFDADKPNRMTAGLTDRALGYSVGDNHSVTMAFVISDMKKAEDFSKSPELKKKMEEAGVEGPPTFFYYTVVKRY